jgi:hypothetical protein
VPNSSRDSSSSSGSAGIEVKVISGDRPVPVTRMIAERPVMPASAVMSSSGSLG